MPIRSPGPRALQICRRASDMPSLPNLNIKLPSLTGTLGLGRSGSDVVGLDVQPGFAGAVQASSNGSILAQHAAYVPLGSDVVREGEVVDPDVLSQVLRELFAGKGLGKRVRAGVANQRTVMRTLELPPVTDRKELAAAVRFQAQDLVPMPLSNAVLDFHPLGVIDTPGGPRQRVVLVAAQLDMVEHLLSAVRGAGLQPVGIDLSAFALIRSLYAPRPESEEAGRVVYLNVDGLTNLAIAEGAVCRFTRVVGAGMEGMATELAERLGIPVTDAREMLLAVDLGAPAAGAMATLEPEEASSPHELAGEGASFEEFHPEAMMRTMGPEGHAGDEQTADEPREPPSPKDHEALEHAVSFAEMSSVPTSAPELEDETPQRAEADDDARRVLENGVREISGEVRNSLDFHRSQERGGEVSHVVLSGSVLDFAGFADALQRHLGLDVRTATVPLADDSPVDPRSMHRLSVAAGLATEELHQ
jgi:type IV pilus assembly protein PilM